MAFRLYNSKYSNRIVIDEYNSLSGSLDSHDRVSAMCAYIYLSVSSMKLNSWKKVSVSTRFGGFVVCLTPTKTTYTTSLISAVFLFVCIAVNKSATVEFEAKKVV